MMSAAADASSANPFPGLRPFREEEEYLFFGRETQVDVMVDKLAATRFLCVVGTSGSGKSSLVNCGLLPALHRGLMAAAGSRWRVAMLRPGNRPLKALAEALVKPGVLDLPMQAGSGFEADELMEASLRLGKLALVDAVEMARLPDGQNLVVVVDQFEELFRYQALAAPGAADRATSAAEDATAFVNLLLEAVAQVRLPIHVVLTMRSDFLGDCARFFGLPEAINRSQYLVPRLTRDERRLAITGPLGVRGVEIDPALLTRLVNDVGENPDQLSILQHALNRTWAQWRLDGAGGLLAQRHYDAIGTMANALDGHAREAYDKLGSERLKQVCAALFKAITDKSTDARGTRRPTRLDVLVPITAATADELRAVIEVFREPERSFLMPPAGVALEPETPIDISHESLMRVWKQLKAWANDEAQAAQVYRRLAETAELERLGKAGLLRPPDLPFALDWRAQVQPTREWAARYRGGFDEVSSFLERSQQAFQAEALEQQKQASAQALQAARLRRTRMLLWVALPIGLLLIVMTTASLLLYRDASHQRDLAAAAVLDATREKQKALSALALAERSQVESRLADSARQAQSAQIDRVLGDKPQLRQAIEQAVQDQRLVYLQYPDDPQLPTINRLRQALGQAGYSAPGSEKVRVAPAVDQLRYFRAEDEAEANKLTGLLKRWGWVALRPAYIKGYEAQSRVRQFELWVAHVYPTELARLLEQINAPSADDRKAAGQALQDRYTTSSLAIAQALALFQPERYAALTDNGRLNALYFLTRTAVLAWDPSLESAGRELLAFMRARDNVGNQARAELRRLEALLDAVRAGEPTAKLG